MTVHMLRPIVRAMNFETVDDEVRAIRAVQISDDQISELVRLFITSARRDERTALHHIVNAFVAELDLFEKPNRDQLGWDSTEVRDGRAYAGTVDVWIDLAPDWRRDGLSTLMDGLVPSDLSTDAGKLAVAAARELQELAGMTIGFGAHDTGFGHLVRTTVPQLVRIIVAIHATKGFDAQLEGVVPSRFAEALR